MQSIDDPMREAIRYQLYHVAAAHRVDRRGWTRQQWIDDARRLFNDLDGSVVSLVNGHVSAMLAELDERSGNDAS